VAQVNVILATSGLFCRFRARKSPNYLPLCDGFSTERRAASVGRSNLFLVTKPWDGTDRDAPGDGLDNDPFPGQSRVGK
jgi:hypothetical protein